MNKVQILIVDDDEDVLLTARMILKSHYDVITLKTPKQLQNTLSKYKIRAVILDMNFKPGATQGSEGLFWLREIKKIDQNIEVIMNTAYGDIELAVECMKEGARDFLVKPWKKEKLISTLNNVVQLALSKSKISRLENTREVMNRDADAAMGELIGQSPEMTKVYDKISKVARTDANVLILGENGTGKELVARAIHKLSNRSYQNFVKVDLGALSSTVFESELFGHVKGAFTDAKNDKTGRIEIAHEGTLFLDEIGNTSPNQQTKLLSALQNRQITKIGSNKTINVDIRLISATNQNPIDLVKSDEFREDLLYRINTITIDLPPLRERRGDISLLARHFLKQFKDKYQRPQLKLSNTLLDKLENYSWPGNVRELRHAMERAVILSDNKINESDILPQEHRAQGNTNDLLNVDEVEKNTILKALDNSKGNLSQASKSLGMGRSTLYRKLKKYNISI